MLLFIFDKFSQNKWSIPCCENTTFKEPNSIIYRQTQLILLKDKSGYFFLGGGGFHNKPLITFLGTDRIFPGNTVQYFKVWFDNGFVRKPKYAATFIF